MPTRIFGDPQPFCPDCGNPSRAGHACSHCGFTPHAPHHFPGGPFAFFRPSFYGIALGGLAAIVLGAYRQILPADSGPLSGLVMCLVCGIITSVVGKHLTGPSRYAYGQLLVSLCLGGLVTVLAVLVQPPHLTTCATLWLTVAVLAFVLQRRFRPRDEGE